MKRVVQVPKIGTKPASVIAARSAIVSDPAATNERGALAYFEGNLFGAENLKAYHARLSMAATRLLHDYPTKAVARFDSKDLITVALYDTDLRAITTVYNGEILCNWAEEALVDITGVRLPAGHAAWEQAVAAAKGAQPVAHGQIESVLPFRTRAGQIFFFKNDGSREVEVLGDDDPRIMLFEEESQADPRLLS